MKPWEEMTNRERAEQTYRDIKKRQERREAGVREATSFRFESAIKTMERASHSKKRGCRSCR